MSSTSTGGHQVRTGGPARTQTPTSPAPGKTAKSILARLDRISVWSLPFMFIGIIGTGFLFAFYDVFDIYVSFIQSCVALKHGCTPANAVTTLRVPVVLNLAGYVIGALALAPISDRIGRRNMLLVHDGPHRPRVALQRACPGLHAVCAGARHHRDRRGRRSGDRQHVHRRGRPAPQPRAVGLGDLHHVLARRAARHLARAVPDDHARPMAARNLVRASRSWLYRRLALDV